MFEPRQWDFTMKTQVGGKQGFNETATVTNISWPKNEFYEDETIDIAISCDNSQCAHGVRHYDVALVQRKQILSSDGERPARNETVVYSKRWNEGEIAAFGSLDFVISFPIKQSLNSSYQIGLTAT